MISFTPPVELKASRGFLEDTRGLPDAEKASLEDAGRLLLAPEIPYPSLKARPIERNPDRQFRLMNIEGASRSTSTTGGPYRA